MGTFDHPLETTWFGKELIKINEQASRLKGSLTLHQTMLTFTDDVRVNEEGFHTYDSREELFAPTGWLRADDGGAAATSSRCRVP